jgi:hypothetical protein
MVMVVVGVIDHDGSILISQRNAGDRLAFKWEFPGGKVEADAPPEHGLVRERCSIGFARSPTPPVSTWALGKTVNARQVMPDILGRIPQRFSTV